MVSQSCQQAPESARVNKGPCHAVLFGCSSLSGSIPGPPKKCGEPSKPVQPSTVGSSSECQAGLLRLLLLLPWYMHMAGGLEVRTTKEIQMALLHDNVTLPCQVPGSPHLDIGTVGIIWFRKKDWDKSEVPIYQFYGSHRNVFRTGANVSGLERGDASLHLPRIELSEAGEYHCKLVVTPEQAEGTIRLDVLARPTMKLLRKPATARKRNGEGQYLICKLDGFYPEAFKIKWEKSTLKESHFQEITEGVNTDDTVKNGDGTFSVTSSLLVKPALKDHENIYHCVVSHRSLLDPERLNITLPEKGSKEIYVTIVAPCVLLLLVIVYGLWKCCHLGASCHLEGTLMRKGTKPVA